MQFLRNKQTFIGPYIMEFYIKYLRLQLKFSDRQEKSTAAYPKTWETICSLNIKPGLSKRQCWEFISDHLIGGFISGCLKWIDYTFGKVHNS